VKALLLDPEEQTTSRLDIEPRQQAVESLLGHNEIDFETYIPALGKRIRVSRDSRRAEDSRVPGYLIEHTGGAVQRAKCLVVGIDEAGGVMDLPQITISHPSMPNSRHWSAESSSDRRGSRGGTVKQWIQAVLLPASQVR
jgi:hypothetical protein